jgi:putative glutamine transport system substrate-binding protein
MKASSGGVFGLGNLTITSERKREISFSEPFMTNVAILVTQKSAPSLMNLKDIGSAFKGMKAYVAKGTTHDKVMTALKTQYFKEMPINYTTSSTESLEQVLRDDKAFCYQDLVIYFDAVEDKKPIKRHSVGDRPGESFGIMMPPNSDWAPVFNAFLKDFVKSSEYRKILLAHLGPDALNIMDAASK